MLTESGPSDACREAGLNKYTRARDKKLREPAAQLACRTVNFANS